MFDSAILAKKGLRSDSIWTHPLAFKSFLKRVPLYLDTRALMQSQYWPREKIDELRDQRLSELFREAVGVPYWKELIGDKNRQNADVLGILRSLPVSPKGTLAALSEEEGVDRTMFGRADDDHTSGSTGRPFHFYFDWHAGLRSFAVTERIFRTATGDRRYPIVYMRWRPRNGFTPYHEWFFVRGFHGIQHRLEEFKELGRKFPRGFVLYGYTSSVVEVARQMEKNGIELPIRAAMATGEGITDSDKALVERVMKTEFFGVYASREAGYLAYECPEHKLHISEEWAYIEIVDETGRPVENGKEGRVAVTCFDNRVMPFIRYELGDRGIISDKPCACGRTLRTITLRGRTAELIELEDGRVVALLDVSSAIDRFWDAVRQFQVIQKSKRSFVFRVVPGPNYASRIHTLETLLRQLMHPNVEITWETMEAIPEAKSGKASYFVKEPSAN